MPTTTTTIVMIKFLWLELWLGAPVDEGEAVAGAAIGDVVDDDDVEEAEEDEEDLLAVCLATAELTAAIAELAVSSQIFRGTELEVGD